MEQGGINFDIFRGLPKSKSAWPAYLGDHYNKGSLTINDVVQLLMEQMVIELKDRPTETRQVCGEFVDVWNQFVAGANFGDPQLFQNMLKRADSAFAEYID